MQLLGESPGTGDGEQKEGDFREYTSPLPKSLRLSLEFLAELDLSDVQVHYNSPKPALVNAVAYAQGVNIYLSIGAERCLPHESWHVVQQKQGRVCPTVTVNGIELNDTWELEKEADVMGGLAAAISTAFDVGYINFFD